MIMDEGFCNYSSVSMPQKASQESEPEDDTSKSSGYLKPLPTSYKIQLTKDAAQDVELLQACHLFNVPVQLTDEVEKNEMQQEDVLTIYVVNSFDTVKKNGHNYVIFGRTAVLEFVKKQQDINEGTFKFPILERPLYCHSLSGQVICFEGYKKSNNEDVEKLKSLILLVHHMGGSVRKEANCKTTFVIAKICEGKNYMYAAAFGVNVVSEMWVFDAWQNRHVVGFSAVDPNFVFNYKLKPFQRSKVCFLGFPEAEKNHMAEILKENGGEAVNLEDPRCTHLVVDESKASTIPSNLNHVHIVKVEWFWTSVQHEYRQLESDFKINDSNANFNITTSNLNETPVSAVTSGSRTRKRKRLRDRFSSFSSDLSPGQLAQKRRSSTSDVSRLDGTRLSEASFLDYTTSPDNIEAEALTSPPEKSKTTARYHKFVELCQTETNYVRILKTIMTLFKDALERMVDEKEQLLNATEMKIIFGHLPPIYSTHCNMLEELKQMLSKWNEECSIGNLILKYSNDLLKAYPPFINFFENTRDMLNKCDKANPRFHAFLKVCQSKPECGRQSLQDLLIRPVQRLPSVNLLLNDILRYTNKSSSDYKALEAAISSIQEVMTHINEDKRKTEGQVALFDIFNDIENCPAHLVSSQRCFINKCEVTELSDCLSGRGNPLVLFLFSDVIEVCKKKMKAFNNLRSPKENGVSKHSNAKLYKHVKLLPLSAVLKVVDVYETEECQKVFTLMMKGCHELKEEKNMIYSFTVTDESVEKLDYLRLLCNQIANVVCRTDTESYLISLEAQQLDIVSSEVATGTLGKAFNKFATKTRIKVGRALSFNKTPNKLKRAVSTMLSPFGNQNALTPTTHLANLQLAALPAVPMKLSEKSDKEQIT